MYTPNAIHIINCGHLTLWTDLKSRIEDLHQLLYGHNHCELAMVITIG
jgi:hypothetical protein